MNIQIFGTKKCNDTNVSSRNVALSISLLI